MDDVYRLLVQHKQQDESFSDEKGEAMLKDLEKFREVNRISLRKRLS